ncbi:MAG TPA: DnaB-like helicase N-terminal domain-containing protein, partial [Candidatus Acidoferrum sp.]|nr:DnaB-like helicase N-terminal domain-containing protein [Candidatus Acidoferrum sp.]
MAIDVNLERPLPHNLDAERSILGAILLDNHALNPAVEKLKTDDFFLDPHRRIFERMIALAEAQQAIDLVTLTEDLHRSGGLEAAGGAAYLAQLVDGVPRISNIEHYARIVKEKSMLRNLAHTALAIQERALAAEEDADAILDNAESSI